jgi:hypothetical protein
LSPDASDTVINTNFQKETSHMAAGSAPAPETKGDTKTETAETCQARPATLKQRLASLFCEIFKGREEYLGWHQ